MRILLIEDEPKVSALVKRGLTAERYAVDIAADGREGLEYTETYPYDLILLDLMLPSLSG
jgi:DNA-binding response OmpR family regulator